MLPCCVGRRQGLLKLMSLCNVVAPHTLHTHISQYCGSDECADCPMHKLNCIQKEGRMIVETRNIRHRALAPVECSFVCFVWRCLTRGAYACKVNNTTCYDCMYGLFLYLYRGMPLNNGGSDHSVAKKPPFSAEKQRWHHRLGHPRAFHKGSSQGPPLPKFNAPSTTYLVHMKANCRPVIYYSLYYGIRTRSFLTWGHLTLAIPCSWDLAWAKSIQQLDFRSNLVLIVIAEVAGLVIVSSWDLAGGRVKQQITMAKPTHWETKQLTELLYGKGLFPLWCLP